MEQAGFVDADGRPPEDVLTKVLAFCSDGGRDDFHFQQGWDAAVAATSRSAGMAAANAAFHTGVGMVEAMQDVAGQAAATQAQATRRIQETVRHENDQTRLLLEQKTAALTGTVADANVDLKVLQDSVNQNLRLGLAVGPCDTIT